MKYVDKKVNSVYTVTDEKIPSYHTFPGDVYGRF